MMGWASRRRGILQHPYLDSSPDVGPLEMSRGGTHLRIIAARLSSSHSPPYDERKKRGKLIKLCSIHVVDPLHDINHLQPTLAPFTTHLNDKQKKGSYHLIGDLLMMSKVKGEDKRHHSLVCSCGQGSKIGDYEEEPTCTPPSAHLDSSYSSSYDKRKKKGKLTTGRSL
ncbi:hypothetical protein BHM03_00000001 [Ensete ventricosum]|nr:hypothetical protein BHM03_00000001 [Ensete ventricosum]